jgi:DNA-binding protein Fis
MVDQEQNKDRLLPELVSAVADATGEALQQQVASLENYVQNLEQQAVSKVEEKVKKSCLSCIM